MMFGWVWVGPGVYGFGETRMERDEGRTRQRDKERKRRGNGEGETFPLKIWSLALRTMVFDVAKLESMLRDALDEVSGLENARHRACQGKTE